MGYFSNGTEGMDYEATVCSRCVHYDTSDQNMGCPILRLHMVWNYDACDDDGKRHALDSFIPRHGIYNGLCTMFHPIDASDAEKAKAWDESVKQAAEKVKP